MKELFVVYVAAFMVPLVFQSWRVAIFGLGLQGLVLGSILVSLDQPWSTQLLVEYVYMFAIRGLILPWYLLRRLKTYVPRGEFVLIRQNLFQWVGAGLMLLIAFVFGNRMAPDNMHEAWQVGTAAGAILVGFLILCNQDDVLGQIIGLFTIEGGMALIELLSPHAMPFPAMIGVTVLFVVFMLTCGRYLSGASADADNEALMNESKVII